MAKARFVYRGKDRQVEDIARRSKQSGGGFDSFLTSDVQMFKAREGDCAVRILPPTWDDVDKWKDGWEIQIFMHYGVGPDEGAYLCLDKMKGESCPVCEARREATDPEEAKELRAGWRALCWVIDRDNEKAGPQVWSMPVSLFRDINARSIDKRTNAVILIDDPEEGFDVLFHREGTDKRTKYTQVEVERDPTPLHDEDKTQAKWLEYIQDNPLPEILKYYESSYIEGVLFGRGKKEEEGDDDATGGPSPRRGRREVATDDEPTSRRSRQRSEEPSVEEEVRTPRRRAAAVEPEPEVEDEPDKPPPRRTRGVTNGTAHDEDGVVEEDPPRSSRRRVAPEEAQEEATGDDPPTPSSRRRGATREAPEEDKGGPVQQARRQLDRLKARAR